MPKKILENKKIEILDSYLENLLLLDLKIADEEFCIKNNISRSLLNKWLNEFGGKELFKRKYSELSEDGKLIVFSFKNYRSLKFSWYLLFGVTSYLFGLWAVLFFLSYYYFEAVITLTILLILYYFLMFFFRKKFF
tara:strand:+ start:31 stop:438 length:408 start_codon:yes stop_codon:yes gene_type:complete